MPRKRDTVVQITNDRGTSQSNSANNYRITSNGFDFGDSKCK